jgi:hypothetical protein
VERAVVQIPGDDAAAAPSFVHDQVEAKYSMKNSASCFSACWYSVCSMAWPVRSAAAQVRCAMPLP